MLGENIPAASRASASTRDALPACYVLQLKAAEICMPETVDPNGFDTSGPGMSEARWTDWVSGAPVWVPAAKHIIVVAPHPDDETLGAGGLIFSNRRSGKSVTIISITDGEAACPEIPALAAMRRREFVGAMRQLGLVESDTLRLRIPDGAVAECEFELRRALLECIPDGAMIVAPFETDGHPDHDAAGRACCAVAAERGLTLARYPVWAWFRGAPSLFSERQPVRFLLDEAAQQAKARALNCFRSQLDDRPGGAIVPLHVLEYFRRSFETFLL